MAMVARHLRARQRRGDYAFMAAWLNVFLLVGMGAALRVGLAVLAVLIGLISVKDFARLPSWRLAVHPGVRQAGHLRAGAPS